MAIYGLSIGLLLLRFDHSTSMLHGTCDWHISESAVLYQGKKLTYLGSSLWASTHESAPETCLEAPEMVSKSEKDAGKWLTC